LKQTKAWFNKIWQQCPDALCATTNGTVSRDGKNVMGVGTAKEAMKILAGSTQIVVAWKSTGAVDKDAYAYAKRHVGSLITEFGNVTQILLSEALSGDTYRNLVALPTKSGGKRVQSFEAETAVVESAASKFTYPGHVPGWALKSTPSLIIASLLDLVALTDINEWKNVWLPMPGGGAGEMTDTDTAEVWGFMQEMLDNRFTVFSMPDRKY